jgi:glycosyltransferase involved in cell wall biosynthesis
MTESSSSNSCPILVPAYRPDGSLVSLVSALKSRKSGEIVIIDDGSGPEYQDIFDELRQRPGVCVLSHAVNLGKGAALKTGINYVMGTFPAAKGVVTADADGQHHPDDIASVMRAFLASPDALILGSRAFDGAVPARSRFGNALTRLAMRLLLGQNLHDTQTGLRAIPTSLMPALVAIPASRYEFELEMLIAAKHRNTPVLEEPIRTIYESGNRSSHFNPLLDSMRIYFVLLRFSLISLMTAAIDNAFFVVILAFSGKLLLSQLCGRAIAVGFNYFVVRKAVFRSERGHATVLPRYLALVAISGSLSYSAILVLNSRLGIPVITAKLIAETLLFLVNFALQRDFVFTRRKRHADVPGARHITQNPEKNVLSAR